VLCKNSNIQSVSVHLPSKSNLSNSRNGPSKTTWTQRSKFKIFKLSRGCTSFLIKLHPRVLWLQYPSDSLEKLVTVTICFLLSEISKQWEASQATLQSSCYSTKSRTESGQGLNTVTPVSATQCQKDCGNKTLAVSLCEWVIGFTAKPCDCADRPLTPGAHVQVIRTS